MKDMAQTERQIFILLLLSENKRGYTINDIHASLEKWNVIVDRKTITRDIDSLSGICFISEEERNGKTYYTADKFRLKDITFTSPEMISFAFLLELLKPYQNITMGKSSKELIHKIIDNTSNLNKEFIRHFTDTVSINTNDYIHDNINPDTEQKLQYAIQNKYKVNIIYRSFGSDEDTFRRIHPYELLINDGALSIVAYCELRNSVRDFRLSRIKNIEVTEEHFNIPKNYFDTKDRSKFIHLSGTQSEKVVIQFSNPYAKYLMEYEAELADELIPVEEGVLFIRATAITEELIRWILKYGSGAKVLEPIHLQDQIKSELKRCLENYI